MENAASNPPSESASSSSSPLILSAIEARVLACLMEKEATTPDVYPLSLNSLINACNQKSNRSPAMSLDEDVVSPALELLREKHLVTVFAGAGARAMKYRHKFDEAFPVEPVARAMLCELMLRGPQTTAGLRGNCERMTRMPDAAESEAVLRDLANRADPLVVKLPRQPGQKEARWAQLLTGEVSPELASGGDSGSSAEPVKVAMTMKLPDEAEARLAALEADVAGLKVELSRLRAALGED